MNKPPHSRRGFTLMEVMVVGAIIAIASALGIGYLGSFKRRGNFASATGDLTVALRLARVEAYNRGTRVIVVVDSVGGSWWVIEDAANAIDLSSVIFTFNKASPAPAGDNLILSGTLPTYVTFATAAPTVYLSGLPAPYDTIPTSAGCTFCMTSGTNVGLGSIAFTIGSGATFSGGGTGASLTMRAPGAPVDNQMIFAMVGRTGTVETFEVEQ